MLEELNRLSRQFHPWIWNALIVAASIVLGALIKLLLVLLLKLSRNKERYSFFRSLLTHLGASLNHFIPLVVLNILLPLMKLSHKNAATANKLLEVAIIISFSALLINIVKIVEDYVYYRYDLNKADNLKERKIRTQLQFIRKLVVGTIILLTIAAVLLNFDNVRRIGAGLLTGVGVGGIIIGFAAQKSLGNLLAGLQIAFTQPIRIDDVLVVENEWGRVEEITLTYVVLRIWDQRRLVLPITYFIEKPFQNWTRHSAEIIGTVFIYTDYDIAVEELRTEFTRLVGLSNLWDKKVAALQVTNLTESTMEIRMLVSSSNSSLNFDLRCYVRENMLGFVRNHYPESLPKTRIVLSREAGIRNEAPRPAAMPDDMARSPGAEHSSEEELSLKTK